MAAAAGAAAANPGTDHESLDRYQILEPVLVDLVIECYPVRATWAPLNTDNVYVCPQHPDFKFTEKHHLADNPGPVPKKVYLLVINSILHTSSFES